MRNFTATHRGGAEEEEVDTNRIFNRKSPVCLQDQLRTEKEIDLADLNKTSQDLGHNVWMLFCSSKKMEAKKHAQVSLLHYVVLCTLIVLCAGQAPGSSCMPRSFPG